jgi:DNA-binding protein HU-beta
MNFPFAPWSKPIQNYREVKQNLELLHWIFMGLTKSAIIDGIAEKTGVTKQTAEAMLECLAQLAYANAKDEFTVPGIGKLVMVDRKARTARNPKTGEVIQIPACKALKFRISKAAKDAILGA